MIRMGLMLCGSWVLYIGLPILIFLFGLQGYQYAIMYINDGSNFKDSPFLLKIGKLTGLGDKGYEIVCNVGICISLIALGLLSWFIVIPISVVFIALKIIRHNKRKKKRDGK